MLEEYECEYDSDSTVEQDLEPNIPIVNKNNPYIIQPGNVFFMHMILMDSDSELAMNLGESYLVTKNGIERLGKQKLDLVVL